MTTAVQPPFKTLLNWSGGKDSALALHRLQQEGRHAVTALLTTMNGAYGRVSMHGVRQELIQAQADRIGLPLHTLALPETTSMTDYAQQMADTLRPFVADGVTHAAFGDIFLEDLRTWRETQLSPVGLSGVFPLWQADSMALLDEFWAAGFQTIVVAVNGQVLDRSFCGRVLDRQFVADLPAGVDPCGENGEFHTFVFDAPYFTSPIAVRPGEPIERTYTFTDADGINRTTTYYFCDLAG
ncbi:diphthine--ammonia ligase [Fibrella sp. WM1]|uniref:Dph6-related ATP pyrophosphatase n=1 Tax=Fibrella musci TaxID=3242485 RepID=UPI00351FCD90